jgi:flagellar basal-body rod protein FlgC
MSEFAILGSAAAGMEAQRAALDVAARNVAAAEAGEPGSFERLVPRFAFPAPPGGDAIFPAIGGAVADRSDDDVADDSDDALAGYSEADAFPVDPAADAFPGDPGEGSVPPIRYLGTTAVRGVEPDAITEMVAVLNAQRAYEADAAVFDAGKRLAERTIETGRQ